MDFDNLISVEWHIVSVEVAAKWRREVQLK